MGRSCRSSGSPPVSRILLDAETGEDAGQPVDLLEGEDGRAGQPHVLLLRHAVAAAHVAAVGDGDAEVAERPAESVRGQQSGDADHEPELPAGESPTSARPAPTHSTVPSA